MSRLALGVSLVLLDVVLTSCGADSSETREASAADCSDSIDNDRDSFVDCGDQDCVSFCEGGDGDADADADADGDSDSDGDADAEECNGLDDDGDQEIDEGNPGSGVRCLTGLEGRCEEGSTSCVRGSTECVPDAQVLPETCANRGSDDDCNDIVDDVPDLGLACPTGLDGRCRDGTWTCVGDVFTCLADASEPEPFCPDGVDHDCDGLPDDGAGPGVETCANPGADDDCDGATDNILHLGEDCDTGLDGECGTGQQRCVDVAMECVQVFAAREEECDTFEDEDCDGEIDEAECIDPYLHHNGWGQSWREEDIRVGEYGDVLAEHACLEYVAANPGAVGPDGGSSCVGYWDCSCDDGSVCFRLSPADPDWPLIYWYYEGPLVGVTTETPCEPQFTWD